MLQNPTETANPYLGLIVLHWYQVYDNIQTWLWMWLLHSEHSRLSLYKRVYTPVHCNQVSVRFFFPKSFLIYFTSILFGHYITLDLTWFNLFYLIINPCNFNRGVYTFCSHCMHVQMMKNRVLNLFLASDAILRAQNSLAWWCGVKWEELQTEWHV